MKRGAPSLDQLSPLPSIASAFAVGCPRALRQLKAVHKFVLFINPAKAIHGLKIRVTFTPVEFPFFTIIEDSPRFIVIVNEWNLLSRINSVEQESSFSGFVSVGLNPAMTSRYPRATQQN
jgi:hypothetical protein